MRGSRVWRERVVGPQRVSLDPIDKLDHHLVVFDGDCVEQLSVWKKLHAHTGRKFERGISSEQAPAPDQTSAGWIARGGV